MQRSHKELRKQQWRFSSLHTNQSTISIENTERKNTIALNKMANDFLLNELY